MWIIKTAVRSYMKTSIEAIFRYQERKSVNCRISREIFQMKNQNTNYNIAICSLTRNLCSIFTATTITTNNTTPKFSDFTYLFGDFGISD